VLRKLIITARESLVGSSPGAGRPRSREIVDDAERAVFEIA